MDRTYEAPQIEVVGDVADITKQNNNKVGSKPDTFTGITGIVGSIIPFP